MDPNGIAQGNSDAAHALADSARKLSDGSDALRDMIEQPNLRR